MEDIVCFLGLKVFNSDNSNMFSAVEKRMRMHAPTKKYTKENAKKICLLGQIVIKRWDRVL